MKKTPWIISAAVAGALVIGGGGAAFAASNEAAVSVYGQQSTVRTFSPTVGSLLEAQGVQIRSTDLVTPSVDSELTDGIDIQVIQRNPVTITVDGEKHEVLTTGDTVADALDEVDLAGRKPHVRPAPETELSAEGTAVTVHTRKEVTFKGQYGEATFGVYSGTVGDGMEEVLMNIEDTDTAKPGRDEKITDGMTVTVQRVREKKSSTEESIPFETRTKESDELADGTKKVTTEGEKGTRETTVRTTTVDGKVTKTKVLTKKVTKKPVDEVVVTGTKKALEPAPELEAEKVTTDSSSSADAEKASSSTPSAKKSSSEKSSEPAKKPSSQKGSSPAKKSSSAKSSSSAKKSSSSSASTKSSRSASAPSVSNGSVWDTIAQCESGGNWSINTGNGFSGGLQFTDQSWRAFGGGAYAPSAHQASRAQQIAVAKKVQAAQGWGAWPGCTSKLGIG